MVLLVGAAVALVVFQQGYRNLEAVLASHLFAGGDIRTWAGGDSPIVVFRLGETRAFGLEITPECTSAFLIAPLPCLARPCSCADGSDQDASCSAWGWWRCCWSSRTSCGSP